MQSLTSLPSTRPVLFTPGPMLRISGLTTAAREELMRALTCANPAIAQARRFSGFASRDIPRHLYGYVMDGSDLMIAPGYASRAFEYVRSSGFDVEVNLAEKPRDATPMLYQGEERDYQRSVVEAGLTRRQGYFVCPCGGGKTDMGVWLIARWGLRTLVIVHTRELLKQWVARIKSRLGIDAATFGGGSKRQITGQERVIVATVQMLKKSPSLLAQLGASIQYAILDESHHTPAASFTQVLAKLNPWVRHGFTATEYRTDGLSMMMHWWIGPKIAEVPRQLLEGTGHIVRPALCMITTRFATTYDPDVPGDYSRLMKTMCEDADRLQLISRYVNAWHEKGRVHIILTGSIDYGYKIFDLLRASANIVPVMCHGGMSKRDRDAAIAAVQDGSANALIATSLADEGLDIPQLSDLWCVTPTRSESKAEQRSGRVCRPYPGKPKPRIHDIVDPLVSREREDGSVQRIFVNQFRNRFFRCYRRIADFDQKQVSVVLDGGEL